MGNIVNPINAGVGGAAAEFDHQLLSEMIQEEFSHINYMKNLITLIPNVRNTSEVKIVVNKLAGAPTRVTHGSEAVFSQHNADFEVLKLAEYFEKNFWLSDDTDANTVPALEEGAKTEFAESLSDQFDASVMFEASTSFQGGTVGVGDPDYLSNDWTAGHAIVNPYDTTTGGAAVIGDGVTPYVAGNATPLTVDGILSLRLRLTAARVRLNTLCWVIPPSAEKSILANPQFTDVDRSGRSDGINGMVGALFGIPVVMSTICPEINGGLETVGILMSKKAVVYAESWAISAAVEESKRHHGTGYYFNHKYGRKTIRPTAGISFVVPV